GEPLLQVLELALGPSAAEAAVFHGRHTGRIIAAVFEAAQRLNHILGHRPPAQNSNNAAHWIGPHASKGSPLTARLVRAASPFNTNKVARFFRRAAGSALRLAVFYQRAEFCRPAGALLLPRPRHRQGILGNVAGDDATRGDVGALAHFHGCNQGGVGANEGTLANLGHVLVEAVVVAN